MLAVAAALRASTAPAGSANLSIGDLSDEQYSLVRDKVWAADHDFGGYSVDFTTHTLTLHPVAGSSEASALLSYVGAVAAVDDGLPKLWTVMVTSVTYSLAELRAVQNEVVSLKYWPSVISAVHVDTAVNAVYIGFTALQEDIAKEAYSLFGDRVELAVEPYGSVASRNTDSIPWWGGDYISGGSNSCTGGFPVIRRSTGQRGMLTAGHCFGLNTTVYQQANTMGTVRFRQYGSGQTDLEFFDTPGGVQGKIYTGCQSCTTSVWVNGLGAASVGAIVCSDGYVSAPADCTVGISWIDGCMFMTSNGNTVWTCGLALGVASDGRIITQGGDSGGPVYRNLSGGFVQAYGSIVGNDRPPDSNGNIQPADDVVFVEWQWITNNYRAICYTSSNCN